ncbi:hypothetical protein GUITHDRAFT_148137 [Guillardia theta CCMP2712]|uniref:Intimal thickness related receptor IRP domain-containing protein n=1 Tax=Guillardia theta (strain CCMP2712) TaxID=905079 RepID=L1IA60_GUITC|nr:hypothetical protein GUITHDRAFT_148137 [Guillardia theta CCMP2712]EKX33118.1 hypothetical protein GUITHDRAFT_148137 [Guillardia theta CCMP2712]|eukprot:XP_005820098.1 hypothetical protein GUITHDRAFT_148137 [Guillardia theta CCMP2712]
MARMREGRGRAVTFLLLLRLTGHAILAEDAPIAKSASVLGGTGGFLSLAHGFHIPSYSISNTDSEHTDINVKWPVCFGKHSALLGTFCVPGMDASDAKKDLASISFDVAPGAGRSVTLFLLADEDNAYGKFWTDAVANRSCSSISQYAKAVISPGGDGRVQGSRQLQGQHAHLWYLVAVDCDKRICPNVTSAHLTFYHPGTDGSNELCSGSLSVAVLKEAMFEGWRSLSFRNLLNVSGVTPVGVIVLYASFVILCACSFYFFFKSRSAPSLVVKDLLQNAFFIMTIAGICYLAMATGNGLLVLRKTGIGISSKWAYSDSLISSPGDKAHPNPLYDEEYALAPTYPLFYVRHLAWLLVSPLLLYQICVVVGCTSVPFQSLMFFSVSRVVCLFVASAVLGGSRWLFWILSIFCYVALVTVLMADVTSLSKRRGKRNHEICNKLSTVVYVGFGLAEILWIVTDGTKVFSSDVAIISNSFLDVFIVCFSSFVLLKEGEVAVPGLRSSDIVGMDDDLSAVAFSGAGLLGDDLGDLEDNL